MSFDRARYDWLQSQRSWHAHKERGKHADHRWHRSQRRYYAQQICTMPGVFTEIVAEVLREHAPLIARNVEQHNAMLKRLQTPQFREFWTED